MLAGILIAALVALGGGTSFAAEGSLPGDFLYPVKIHVNESIRSSLALSAEAQAALEADLVRERLEEAQELALMGSLDAESGAAIESRLEKHYTSATRESNAVQADGGLEASAEVRAQLEATLNTYAAVLSDASLQEHNSGALGIAARLGSYLSQAVTPEAETSVEVSADTKNEIEATITSASRAIKRAESELARREGTLRADTNAQVSESLRAAIEARTAAEAAFASTAYVDAYHEAEAALKAAFAAQARLDASSRTTSGVGTETRDTESTSNNAGSASDASTNGSGSEERAATGTSAETNSTLDATAEVSTDLGIDLGTQTNAATDARLDTRGSLGL